MKERNGRGQFRATESMNYRKKFKNHFGDFDKTSEEAFMEAALEKYDFKQCQRQDGSIYGVKDSSSCSQKGAKEVKKDEGGEGGESTSKKGNVARLAPKTPEDFKRKPRLLESEDSQAT